MAAFLRYGIVGASALVLHLIVLQGLLLMHACVPWVASGIGFVLACGFNYIMQRLWVFQSERSHAIALPRYVAITTVMLGVNTVLFATLFSFSLPPLMAQTLTTGCIFVLNFVANRRFTFGVNHPATL